MRVTDICKVDFAIKFKDGAQVVKVRGCRPLTVYYDNSNSYQLWCGHKPTAHLGGSGACSPRKF